MSISNGNNKAWPAVAQAPQKSDATKIRDLLDQFAEFEDLVKMDRPNKSIDSFESEIQRTEEKIKNLQENLASLIKAKEFYEGLPFRLGDAAFHKDYGNVIIKTITVNKDDLEASQYVVVTVEKQAKVNVKELVPITDATKALFGRK